MRRPEMVVPLSRNFHAVEGRLEVIVNSLGLVRSLAAAIDQKDAEVSGAQIWGMVGLIEDEAKRALKEHRNQP